MNRAEIPYIFIVTGAESTGKTTLTKSLATHFNTLHYDEYARNYIASIKRNYNYHDLEIIARKQISQYIEAINSGHKIVFFDTWLIITKVWFKVVYKGAPEWLDETIRAAQISGIILNDINIAWEPDPLRENGGEKRAALHNTYIKEIEGYKFDYYLNSGLGKSRLENAIDYIKSKIKV